MFSGTVLVISILALLLQVSSEAVGVQEPSIFPPAPAAAPVGVPVVVPPKVYNPVVLSQLCKDPANYCIYVDQVRPGTVRASPVNATDARKSLFHTLTLLSLSILLVPSTSSSLTSSLPPSNVLFSPLGSPAFFAISPDSCLCMKLAG